MVHEAMTLREYETVQIGPVWDSRDKILSHREVVLLDAHQRKTGRAMFDLRYGSIQATNWVGAIGLGDRCIEVIPKIDEPSDLKVRENLLFMIAAADMIPVAEADIARLANSDKPLLAAYMELYVKKLAREWRKGQIRQYVTLEDNRACLKGKLLIPVHLRKNYLHKERFFTACDEFTCDNSVSRLLKAALRECQYQPFSSHLARMAKTLMLDFGEVSDVPAAAHEIRHTHLDRCTSRFEPVLNMAKFILNKISGLAGKRGDAVYSLMFDMNTVFERFVAAEVESALWHEPVRVKFQQRGKSLLQQNGLPRFALCPDISVYRGDENICLIDTKWKRLDRTRHHDSVSQSDMYQMYAYGKEYDAPRVILLYPRHGDLPPDLADYCHCGTGPEKQIQVKTVDLCASLVRGNGRNRLRGMLRSMVMGQRVG